MSYSLYVCLVGCSLMDYSGAGSVVDTVRWFDDETAVAVDGDGAGCDDEFDDASGGDRGVIRVEEITERVCVCAVVLVFDCAAGSASCGYDSLDDDVVERGGLIPGGAIDAGRCGGLAGAGHWLRWAHAHF